MKREQARGTKLCKDTTRDGFSPVRRLILLPSAMLLPSVAEKHPPTCLLNGPGSSLPSVDYCHECASKTTERQASKGTQQEKIISLRATDARDRLTYFPQILFSSTSYPPHTPRHLAHHLASYATPNTTTFRHCLGPTPHTSVVACHSPPATRPMTPTPESQPRHSQTLVLPRRINQNPELLPPNPRTGVVFP